MWTNLAKRASSTLRNNFRVSSLSPRFCKPQISKTFQGFPDVGVSRSKFVYQAGFSSSTSWSGSWMELGRGHASVAEDIESTDTEDDYDEVQKLLEEMAKAEHKVESSSYKYKLLKRRQIESETEAWAEAAREYEEMLEDMREKKLAPNLPYMQSLFLGWFEPLRNVILSDQDLCKDSKCRMSHAPYFNDLPADMMAVITMHKLMALLMTNADGVGTARVVQAACQIGEAVENEARIYQFMKREKENKSSHLAPVEQRGKLTEENREMEQKQNRLRKRVAGLMKKQKKLQLMGIIGRQDDWKAWGQEAQVKVGSRLMQLLIETAYIQRPTNQIGDGPPDIHPAFKHTLKTLSNV